MALSFVPKPDRSEHAVQRSKAESRDKRCYEIQALLFKKKNGFLFFRKAGLVKFRFVQSHCPLYCMPASIGFRGLVCAMI